MELLYTYIILRGVNIKLSITDDNIGPLNNGHRHFEFQVLSAFNCYAQTHLAKFQINHEVADHINTTSFYEHKITQILIRGN